MSIINTVSTGAKHFDATADMLARSLVSRGNTARLASAFNKARAGQPFTVGAIGGSITGGSCASSEELCYAYRYFDWWRKTFPQCDIDFVNAGIGSTGSLFAAGRVQNDLLSRKPDVVVVEFSVNDSDSDRDAVCFESLIRRILSFNSDTAVIVLFMTTDAGYNVQHRQIPIGQHYSLPMISYRDAVMPEITEGRISWTDISPDNIHPNDTGHSIAAQLLTEYTAAVYAQTDIQPQAAAIPQPLISDAYYNACFLTPDTLPAPLSTGSFGIVSQPFYNMKTAYKTVDTENKPIVFEFDAAKICIFYAKSVESDAGAAEISVDGASAAHIDSAFPGGYGTYCAPQVLLDDTVIRPHTVVIAPLSGSFSFWGIMIA